MIIGILTLVPYDNYGGILQGYALQTVLERMGHKVYIYNTKLYNYKSLKFKAKKLVKWSLRKYVLHRKDEPFLRPFSYEDYRVSELKPFIKKYIHLTRTFHNGTQDIYNFTKEAGIEVVVVGSDQTWRPGLSPDLYHLFGDFIPKDSPIKRIAYAASFGVDKLEYSPNQLDVCKPLLQRFKAVSVRETSGIELCKKYFGVDAEWVLDPTMLLDKEDYMQLIKNYQPIDKKIDFMQYVFFWDSHEREVISKIITILNTKPVNLFPERFLWEVKNKEELVMSKFKPLEEWLYGYANSKFVVTDSFHGTVFCIIFNVPFIVVSPKAVTRFKTLLSLFGLKHRLVIKPEEVTEELVNERIDWEKVNKKREELKKQSIDFLRKALS